MWLRVVRGRPQCRWRRRTREVVYMVGGKAGGVIGPELVYGVNVVEECLN
jgi:hypothetical protein